MFAGSFCRFAGLAMVVALVTVGGPIGVAHAQGAWVGDPKTLDAELSYQFVPSSAVVISPDLPEVPDRTTQNHVISIGGEYVPIDKLALELAIPMALVKSTGMAMHTPPGKWDDGKTHFALTDLRVGARYQVLDAPYVAVTPNIGVTIPMSDYEVIGFATGGRHLKMLHLGLSAGRTFDPYVPNLYLTASYELSIGEKSDIAPAAPGSQSGSDDISQNRSDISAQVGYFFLDGDLSVNLGFNMRKQHGGVSFEDFAKPGYNTALILGHDPILKEEYKFYGGGVSYNVTQKLTLSAVFRLFWEGSNTRNQSLYGLTLGWNVL